MKTVARQIMVDEMPAMSGNILSEETCDVRKCYLQCKSSVDCNRCPVIFPERGEIFSSSFVSISKSAGLEGNTDFNTINEDYRSTHKSGLYFRSIF